MYDVYNTTINTINEIIIAVNAKKLPPQKKKQLIAQLNGAKDTSLLVYEQVYSFINMSVPSLVLMKVLMNQIPSGISPFWVTNPKKACKFNNYPTLRYDGTLIFLITCYFCFQRFWLAKGSASARSTKAYRYGAAHDSNPDSLDYCRPFCDR